MRLYRHLVCALFVALPVSARAQQVAPDSLQAIMGAIATIPWSDLRLHDTVRTIYVDTVVPHLYTGGPVWSFLPRTPSPCTSRVPS